MKRRRTRRPIVQPTPEPGQLYKWDPSDGHFLILSVNAKDREIWMCRALDLEEGAEHEIGIRKRETYNGWRQVTFDAPF